MVGLTISLWIVKKIEAFQYAYPADHGNIEGEILDMVNQNIVIDFKANVVTVNAGDILSAKRSWELQKEKFLLWESGT